MPYTASPSAPVMPAYAPAHATARAKPTPPAAESVRAALRRSRRAAYRPSSPSTAAAATTTYRVSSRRSCELSCAAATPAGIARTASAPRATAARAAPLLLLIRPARGRRPDRAADHPGHRDDRQHIRQGVEQCAPLVAVGVRQAVGQRAREAEEQRGAPGRERPPLPEHEGGQPDEAGAARHVLIERVDEPERQVRAAHRRDRAGCDHRHVADL